MLISKGSHDKVGKHDNTNASKGDLFVPIAETIGIALSSIKTLTDIVGNIGNVEVRKELNSKILDLQTAMLAARQQMLEMQEQYERVLKENQELKQISAPRQKPIRKWGCYEFPGEDGLFCTVCYDTRGQKISASRLRGGHYICNYCKAELS